MPYLYTAVLAFALETILLNIILLKETAHCTHDIYSDIFIHTFDIRECVRHIVYVCNTYGAILLESQNRFAS